MKFFLKWKTHLFFIKFINLYFFKSWVGPLICFLFIPIMSIGFAYINKNYVSTIIPSVLSNVIIGIPFWLISSSMIDIKKNSIVEKYFLFSKKPIYVNSIPLLYFYIIILVSFLINFFVVYLISFDKNNFPINFFQNINVGSLIFTLIFSIFLSLSIASIMYTFVRSIIWNQIICYVLSMFFLLFSGNIIPWVTIITNEPLNIISYFSPFRYINALFIESINGLSDGMNNLQNTNVFNFSTPYVITYAEINENGIQYKQMELFKQYDQILNFLIILIIPIIINGIILNIRQGKRK